MRRRAVPLLLACLASAPALAGVWTNLWLTPDQQGAALLAAGRPAQAAARFASARRKAYADLEAGHYAPAARLLDPYRDATSEYNRGNALAHLGHLRGALAAYEAALKQAPHDADIRHNRDLVARMLAHQPPPPGSTGQQQTGRPGQSGSAGSQPSGTRPPAGQHPGSRSAARNGSTPSPGTPRSGQNAPSPGASLERTPGNAASATGAEHPRTGKPGQARRDAAAAAAIARQQQRAGQGRNTIPASRPGTHGPVASIPPGPNTERSAPPKPRSEKTLALDQWLRQIPNDPAGLLRRKFLIEYMMRHPETNP
ncbi:MAG: tetratricopeptide repeat protein [Steroidobacteraceae bacterium]